MKILHLSDTHGQHNRLKGLPEADVTVHSGDFTFGGSEREVLDFLNWFCGLPYKYKIFIAGNHDDCLWNSEIGRYAAESHSRRICGLFSDLEANNDQVIRE